MSKLEQMLESQEYKTTEGQSGSGVCWISLWKYWPFYDIATYICQGQGVDAESAKRDLIDRLEEHAS